MPVEDFTPEVAEVGAILASRTYAKGTLVGSDGNMAGTFDETTRPTAEQVEALRGQALTEVAPHVVDNEDTPEPVYSLAKTAVARRTAMLVLFSFFEEDLEQASGSYDELEKLYKDALASLEALQPESSASRKGVFSIPMRSPALGALERGEFLGGGDLLP
jgi:hypothetical protein